MGHEFENIILILQIHQGISSVTAFQEGFQMSRLSNIIDKHNDIHWTEDELADWITGLPERKRHFVLDYLKIAKRRGMNIHHFACKARERMEAIDEKNKMSLIDFLSSASTGWLIGGINTGSKSLHVTFDEK